jgi:hypothetical protein
MAIANGSQHSMSYIAESTFGTTPATPVLKALRHSSTTLGLSKDSIQSDELRADRQISDMRHGNKSASGDIGIELSYGSFDDFLEAVLGGTWDVGVPSVGIDQLKVGTTRRSFTIERLFSDITQYHRFTGCNFSTLSLSIAPNAMVTGSLGVIGKGMTTATAIITGATYPAATTTSPFDSFTGTINENNSAIAVITSLDINLDNGMNPLFVVGSAETLQPSIGRSNVSGSVSAYFEDSTLLDKFLNETETSIDFTLVDTAGNEYFFDLPRIKYSAGQPDVSDEGPVTISFDFQALYNAADTTNLIIQRNPI